MEIQGALTQTGNTFDLALNGLGWFQISGANGETLYTRAGSFSTNANGQLATADGYLLNPTITIPNNAVNVTISQSGVVSATIPGQTNAQQLGQLTISMFANDPGLQPLGGNLFSQTAASGTPVNGVPGDPGFATISQGYLESSNVDPTTELVNLIAAQRACLLYTSRCV